MYVVRCILQVLGLSRTSKIPRTADSVCMYAYVSPSLRLLNTSNTETQIHQHLACTVTGSFHSLLPAGSI